MPTLIDTRQSRNRLALGNIGSSADATLDTILSLIDTGTGSSVQDRSTKLVGGGTWEWDLTSTTLSLSADAYVQIPSLENQRNTISSGNISLTADGQVAYVQVARTGTGANILTVSTGTIDSLTLTDTLFVIARRVGDKVNISNSFTLGDGELLELDGALAEINRYFGQLRLNEHPSNKKRVVITGTDTVKLDGTLLGQTLNSLALKFDGAEIDFSTGVIYEDDGSTPLGIDFAVHDFTGNADHYYYYSVGLVPSTVNADNTINAQAIVLGAGASNVALLSAPKSAYTGSLPLGQIVIQNDSATSVTAIEDITQSSIIQLGVGGSGSSSGGSYLNFDESGDADTALLGDYITGQSAIFGDSGTLSGTFEISDVDADIIRGRGVFKYTMGVATDWVSKLVDIPQGYRGRELHIKREYKYNGDDGDINLVVYDIDNAAVLLEYPISAFDGADDIATTLEVSFNCPSDCTQVKYGLQVAVTNASKVFLSDDHALDPFITTAKGGTTSFTTISSASAGTWSSGVIGTPDIWAWFWDDSLAIWDLLSAPSYDISTDGSGVVAYDFTTKTFNANDYVLLVAKGGTIIATPSNEYDSGWILVSAINDILKGASVTDYHEVTLPAGFIDYPAGINVTKDDGTDIYPADYASVVVLSKNDSGGIRVAIDTTGWAGTDKFRFYCSKSARAVGLNLPITVQDFTAIGAVGSVGQQMAGHSLATVEPGTSSAETLALYKFGEDGGAITLDEKGTYNLTDHNTVTQIGGIFGGSTGAADFVTGSTQYFSHPTLLDVAPTAIAIDCWFKMRDGVPAGTKAMFRKVQDGTNSLIIQHATSGKLEVYGTQGTAKIVTSNTTFANGVTDWFYLVTTWDATYGLRIFINGVLDAQNSAANIVMGNGTTSDCEVGGNSAGAYWDGQLANFRIRNKILTQKDVDIGYATTYPVDPILDLETCDLEPLTREDGHVDFTAQYSDPFEIARKDNTLYRYGSLFEATDKLKIVGRA